jgi:hypothetical protein
MAHVAFTLTTTIAASPEQIRPLIAEIQDLGRFHPLISGVKEVAPDTSSFGTPRRRFRVTDRMRAGPLLLRFTYLATMTDAPDGTLVGEAFQPPGIHLISRYTLMPEDSQTRVEEHCTIAAPRLLAGFVQRQAYAAHAQTFQQIKQYLENARA